MKNYLPSIDQIQADTKVIIEDDGNGTKLIGTALFGSATTSAQWKILKSITSESAGITTTTILCAEKEGSPSLAYEHIWDNRASLQFS